MAIKRIFVFYGKGERQERRLDCILHRSHGARMVYRTPPESEAAGLHPTKDDAT
jgi:hypothetical protein